MTRRPTEVSSPAERAARLAAAPPEVRALAALQARTRASSQVSRRAALQGAGLLGLGAFLAACGTSGAPGTGASGGASLEPAKDRSDEDKTLAWANWTLYLDLAEDGKTYPTLEAFSSRRASTSVQRGHRRQRHLLRQDPGPARQRRRHRPGHRGLHRLDGRADDHDGLRPGAGPGEHPERRQHPGVAGRRRLRPRPQALAHVAVRASAASPGTRRRCRAGCAPSPTCGSPSSRAGSRCSTSGATPSG